jgi:hypothetical protein
LVNADFAQFVAAVHRIVNGNVKAVVGGGQRLAEAIFRFFEPTTTGADRWTFTVEATETLNLPAGTLPALKLQRLPRRDYDQKAELWLAPDMGYLPVRIKITQANGDFADLRLRSSGPP